ncbi:hypothetical protein FOA52_000693 [Chlamydomonas sp. UWO 241]|nr:hypothetical protein FOA52_000693 [Chlamydomonas sp. UWO 241]
MAASIDKYTVRGGNKGIALAFVNGTARVVDGQLKGAVGHHASAYFAYMHVMLELQRLLGSRIPDVEFVIATSDRPMVLKNATAGSKGSDGGGALLPVFRFCSSPSYADIQIPIFHFTTKKYSQAMLDVVEASNVEYPWEGKKETLFGRFSVYSRYISPSAPELARRGADGQCICVADTPETTVCAVRTHAIAFAANHTEFLEVQSSPRVPMAKHAGYKYLLHLDGQALSSRIDLLLPLNSLVFKEESGYTTFYYHLLKPKVSILKPRDHSSGARGIRVLKEESGCTTFYHHLLKPKVHYVPVWEETPDDMLKAVQWAREHDDEAKKIAAAGQAFAIKYLSKRARTCYWLELLTQFSKLLRYDVSPKHDADEYAAKRRRRRGGRDDLVKTGVRPGAAEQQAMKEAEEAERADAATPGRSRRGDWPTVEEYLANVAPAYEGGKWLQTRLELW